MKKYLLCLLAPVLLAVNCEPGLESPDDTGCSFDGWDVGASYPAAEGQEDVPLDAMALVKTAHDPPCEGAIWTLSTRTSPGESWEEVATGSLVALFPLGSLSNTWQADLPTLEAETDYALWVEEATDGWLVWQTGATLTSQRGLVPELAIESMTLVEVSTGTEVRVEVLITGVRSDEMPLPVVQIAPLDGEPGHTLLTEEGEASVLVHDYWPENGDDSRCVHARQLEADGAWGPWSEPVCEVPWWEEEQWDCLSSPVSCSTAGASGGPLLLLLLPWLVRRRRRPS